MASKAILVGGFALAAVLGSSAASATNLITNGDFSAGNTGFTHSTGPTGYTYVAPTANALYPEGLYTIAANPISVHSLWVDLGASTNPMLIVNGATSGAPVIWEEDNITTTAGGTYNFSADVMDICCNSSFGSNPNSPSDIHFQVSVNGGAWQNLASYTTAPGAVAQSGDSGVSELLTGSFSSTAGGSFSIRTVNGIDAASGNDFALDNISVTGVPEAATWAMMIVGFAGVGGVMRSSRRQAIAAA